MLGSIDVEGMRTRGSIRDTDVAALRAVYEAATVITAADAESLVALHGACPVKDPAWSDLFVDALAEYVVHQAAPTGYVVAENARWLKASISPFGRIETTTELDLLVHVLETARWTPPSLVAFGLEQVRDAVASGTGPLRAARQAEPGQITDAEVALTGRLVAALAPEAGFPVTRVEADALIAINRAIAAGGATPAWQGLLIRSVGTAVLGALGHAVPPRSEIVADAVARATSWARANEELAPGMMAHAMMVPGTMDGVSAGDIGAGFGSALRIWSSARAMTPEERALRRLERQRLEIVTNEVIEDATDVWLMTRLAEQDPIDANELALLAFVTREATSVPGALGAFAAQALVAA